VGLVAAIVGLLYVSLAWYGFDPLEEGYFLTNARRVQLGGLPYRDFDAPYTPGVFYLYAWMMSWLGQNLVALRVLQVIGRIVYCLALYSAGRKLMPPAFASLAPGLVLLVDHAPEAWSVHPGWYTAPASALAALAMASYISTGRGRWLVAAGVAGGIAFAFKQNLAVYGLMAGLWLLAVAERRLAPVRARGPLRWLDALAPVIARFRLAGLAQTAALLALPAAVLVIVRAFLSPAIVALYVLPMAALGALAAAALVRRAPQRASTRDVDGERVALSTEASFLARPLLMLTGFTAVTLPWLVPLVATFAGELERLGPIAGQIELTGYYLGTKPMGAAHFLLVAALLLAPAVPAALSRAGLWNGRGVVAGLAAGAALIAAAMARDGGPAPWNLPAATYDRWSQLTTAWSRFSLTPRPTDNLLLYLPSIAFWAALGTMVASRGWPGTADTDEGRGGRAAAGSAARVTRQTVRLWYLVAGAALLLNQYPRMDEVHWLWSAGLLLVAGADTLHGYYRRLLRAGWPSGEPARGRAAVYAALLLLPVAAAVPLLRFRLDAWGQLLVARPVVSGPPAPAASTAPAVVAMVAAAAGTANQNAGGVVPVDLPDGSGRVWVPARQGDVLNAAAALLREKTAPGEAIFAYPAIPGFYYLADRPNATRFNHVFRGMATFEDQEQMVRQLEQVRYILWDDGGARYWVVPGDNPIVTEYIRTHFGIDQFVGPYALLSREALEYSMPLPYFLPPAAGR
jgi:hypothetical protein